MGKKIVIQSDSHDRSTDEVISWVKYLEPNIELYTFYNNSDVDFFNLELTGTKAGVKINNKTIDIEDSFWYRRGRFYSKSQKTTINDRDLIDQVISENSKPLIDFLNSGFTINTLNRFQDNNIEKLEMLFLCYKLNIPFPETIVSNNKKDILSFLNKHKKIISKGIKYPNVIHDVNEKRVVLASATLMVNEKIIAGVNSFAPSLFQEYIDKQIEIRSFYLKGKFRSMAIFSQQNEKTKVDYRNYDHKRPNRLVPFKLPEKLEEKLHNLMKELKLNSGSFDIIYTPEGKYYFLEVNPIGQFQWLSQNCNYYIERMIAKEIAV